MAHTYTQLLYHLVFATHERHPWLTPEIRGRVHEYLAGAVRSEGGHAILIGGVDDHVHILARLRQDRALSDIIRDIKANSSGWIHKTFPALQNFAWQRGYGAFTVSASQQDRVREYIACQEEHHRVRTFRDELVEFLKAHGVEYDERYLLD